MTWIIALLVVAMAFGSVMWLRPSPTQQRQARLRMLARELGLDVRLAALPQTHRARVRQEIADPGIVYRLLRFDLIAPLAQDYVLVRDSADSPWERQSGAELSARAQAALNGVLARLPRDAVAVELTPHGPGIYWRERGDEQSVRVLRELLEQLLPLCSMA